MKRAFLAAGVVAISLFCFVHSALAVDGFGQNTTGGAGGTTVTVTTAADLANYVGIINTPYIIQVSGVIDLNSLTDKKISIRSNKTIKGIGENPTIIGDVAFKNGSSNVIIERLTITNPGGYGEGDGIGVKEDINNVFITKCTFYNCDDGCLDITRSTDNVTVSWCKFYYTYDTGHNFVNLIGSSYPAPDDIGKLHVTFHHNWWGAMCVERMLSVRYGRAHIYNNYYSCTGNNYCTRSRVDAECRIENNYFDHVKDPYLYYPEETPLGRIWASGNILDNCTWANPIPPGNEVVFTPPYSYMLDGANDIPTMVQLGAGADGIDFFPHWLFGFYGDFDRSGIVDLNDLAQFAGYWLGTDCNEIANADYNDDCNVNFYEFTIFADNWQKIPPDITAPATPTGLGASASDATVSLDWNDNAESDLAGYNIYRSTTSGSGYSKLNSSLLNSSSYTDSTVTNETMYYYVVTAVDTSSNESEHSSEVSAKPSSGGPSITIQENTAGFCGVEGIIDTKHAGYTGDGFCDTENATGKGINWSVNILTGGTYTLTWRYAHGKTDDRSARLLVNGSEVVSSIAFPPTGAFTTWSTVSVDIDLTVGVKTIRLEGITSNALANIDYMNVTGENLMTAGCP